MEKGFFQAEVLDHGTWTKNDKGMMLRVPVKLPSGDKIDALAMLGEDEEKNAKTRAALKSWDWDASHTWPTVGASIRVNVTEKMRNGQLEYSAWIVNKNAVQKVEGDDLTKFLAEEAAKMRGEKTDPFA